MRTLARLGTGLVALVVASGAAVAVATPAFAAPVTVTAGPTSLTISDSTLDPGQQFTVTATFSNPCCQPLSFASVDAVVTAGSSEITAVGCTGDTTFCSFASTDFAAKYDPMPLNTGQSRSITVTYDVSADPPDGTTVTFDALMEYESFGVGGSFDLPPASAVIANPKADLAVSLSASSSLLSPTIAYNVGVSNGGPSAAQSSTISIQLPTQTVSASGTGCTYNSSTDVATCSFGAIANGSSASTTLNTTLALLSVGLPLTATATRTASTPPDPNAANDSASDSCTVITGLIIVC